ncbi:MAG: amino acid-binding protein [Rhodospirillales bacterium]|nr:MAG: amino acid-binding protein [Rhodospirillales bacterium]
MTVPALVSISCPDRVGLIAAITGTLFDLGGNLGDTSFAVLGAAADFTSVVELPDGTELADVDSALRALPELADAQVSVVPFTLAPVHGPTGRITHRIVVSGGDRPGLVARLSELFIEFGANIVRLDAERIPGPAGTTYGVIMSVHIPEAAAETCLATVANTAGSLGLTCHWEAVG